MPEVIDPTTGFSRRHGKWMSLLMDWTSEGAEKVLAVAISNGVDPGNLRHMAAAIQATREKAPQMCDCFLPAHEVPGPIRLEQLAMGLLLFLEDRTIRRAVADYAQHTYDTSSSQGDVMKDLLDLKTECHEVLDRGHRYLDSGLVMVEH